MKAFLFWASRNFCRFKSSKNDTDDDDAEEHEQGPSSPALGILFCGANPFTVPMEH